MFQRANRGRHFTPPVLESLQPQQYIKSLKKKRGGEAETAIKTKKLYLDLLLVIFSHLGGGPSPQCRTGVSVMLPY